MHHRCIGRAGKIALELAGQPVRLGSGLEPLPGIVVLLFASVDDPMETGLIGQHCGNDGVDVLDVVSGREGSPGGFRGLENLVEGLIQLRDERPVTSGAEDRLQMPDVIRFVEQVVGCQRLVAT